MKNPEHEPVKGRNLVTIDDSLVAKSSVNLYKNLPTIDLNPPPDFSNESIQERIDPENTGFPSIIGILDIGDTKKSVKILTYLIRLDEYFVIETVDLAVLLGIHTSLIVNFIQNYERAKTSPINEKLYAVTNFDPSSFLQLCCLYYTGFRKKKTLIQKNIPVPFLDVVGPEGWLFDVTTDSTEEKSYAFDLSIGGMQLGHGKKKTIKCGDTIKGMKTAFQLQVTADFRIEIFKNDFGREWALYSVEEIYPNVSNVGLGDEDYTVWVRGSILVWRAPKNIWIPPK